MAKSLKDKHKTMLIGEIWKVLLIGCGGTGSYLIEHLCRMISGYNLRCGLCIWDGDTVEPENITRQNFYPWEIGAPKASAMAIRLSGQFGIPILYKEQYFADTDGIDMNSLVISCTDTLASRKIIAGKTGVIRRISYWLDVGNELHHGQAVFGTTHDEDLLKGQYNTFSRKPYIADLPDIAALNPAILRARKRKTKAGCASMPFLQQGFGVNAMAALAAATISKQILVDREVRYSGIYFNVSDGRMQPRMITKDLFKQWA